MRARFAICIFLNGICKGYLSAILVFCSRWRQTNKSAFRRCFPYNEEESPPTFPEVKRKKMSTASSWLVSSATRQRSGSTRWIPPLTWCFVMDGDRRDEYATRFLKQVNPVGRRLTKLKLKPALRVTQWQPVSSRQSRPKQAYSLDININMETVFVWVTTFGIGL